jgi:hypothetical protein
MWRLVLACFFLILRAPAAGVEESIRATLVEPWMNAVLAKDSARVLRFLHPKVQACVNDETREYFESGNTLKPPGLTSRHHIVGLTPWKSPGPLWNLPADGFSYPVPPVYEITLDGDQSDTQIIRYVAPSGAAWFIVAPCPNEKGVVFIRQKAAEGRAQKERVLRLLAELRDPLLSQIKDLLKQHRKIDAVKRYQQATGVQDTAVVVMLMSALDQQPPGGH